MQPAELLAFLADLANEVGLVVRRIPTASAEPGEPPPRSGTCRVGERFFVFLAAADPIEDRIDALVFGLRTASPAALEGRYLPPAVRERLDRGAGGVRHPSGPR
ncbi:hypothetical protein BURK2_01536 [Burkholderiales bacterium]|jgi:hypothetical protein|nr:hypothetical protein BURK2_01536 [Burkholderiales bacterium]